MTEKSIQIVPSYLICPYCHSPNGIENVYPNATCLNCKKSEEIYKFLLTSLSNNHDSDLWSFAFSILSQFELAPIFQGIIPEDGISYKPYEHFIIDLSKRNLPENARLLYVNFTPHSTNGFYSVIPVFNIGQSIRSIDIIPPILNLYAMPIIHKNNKEKFDNNHISSINQDEIFHASMFFRWSDTSSGFAEEHIIKAAEGYWSTDINHMIYNAFAAFELKLSNLIEIFWKKIKKLDEDSYKNLFEKEGICKKIHTQLPLIYKELGEDIKRDKNKIDILHDLRSQRNSIVHGGKLRSDITTDKAQLFSIACWGLILIKHLEKKIKA